MCGVQFFMPKNFDPITEAHRQSVLHGLDEPLAMMAANSIIHSQLIVTTAIDRALKPYGITFAQLEILMLLSFSQAGGLPTTKVGERLLVHPTGITKLVDKLEAKDLVQRESNPTDRRGTLVSITPQGRRINKSASKVVAAIRFGVDLPDSELKQLVSLLGRLRTQVRGE